MVPGFRPGTPFITLARTLDMDDLFDRLQVEGETGIRRLVDERAQENVTLDFKRKRDPAKGAFDKDDRATLAELLSGFANSAGGLAIWGVDARKNEDGIDCAQELMPIAGIERFLSEAQGLVSRLVMPRLDGVSLGCVRCDHDTSTGYLLVRVDRSERRPHRSEAADRKHYFKRSGDSFFAMEHYDIEDAFKRAGSPKLVLDFDIKNAGVAREPDQLRRILYLAILISNVGAASAKYPYIQFGKHNGCLFDQSSEVAGFRPTGNVNGWMTLSGGADHVIHPGQVIPVLKLRVDHVTHPGDKISLGCPPGGTPNFGFECRAGCENAAPVEMSFWKEGSEAIAYLAAASK